MVRKKVKSGTSGLVGHEARVKPRSPGSCKGTEVQVQIMSQVRVMDQIKGQHLGEQG